MNCYPVMVSKHGARLLAPDAVDALKKLLLPRAFLFTPNLEEAEAFTGKEVRDLAGMRAAAEKLRDLGASAVLVKGGHLNGCATDVLLGGNVFLEFPADRIDTRHTHGTGCTYSAAITAALAQGDNLVQAVRKAKRFISEALRTNPGLGAGAGPLNHHAACPDDRSDHD